MGQPSPPKEQQSPPMEVLCAGTEVQLTQPCVDCGQWTGSFCDYCLSLIHILTLPTNREVSILVSVVSQQ